MAGPGAILVSVVSGDRADLPAGLPRSVLALKGREQEVEVVRVRVGPQPDPAEG